MPPILTASAWVLIGTGVGMGHAWLICRALAAASTASDGYVAARLVVSRLPLRLLAVLPFLFLAVRSGLAACLGLVIGLLAGRLMAFVRLHPSGENGIGQE